jgi:hypothetical protein
LISVNWWWDLVTAPTCHNKRKMNTPHRRVWIVMIDWKPLV